MALDLQKYFQLKNADAPQFTDNGNGGYVDANGNTFNSEDMGTALSSARMKNEQDASDYVNQNGGIPALAAAMKNQVNQQFAGKPPSIEQTIANWQVDHFLKYGQTIDRPWTADAESTNQGQALLNAYKQELAQYNAQNGTNLQPTVNSVSEMPVDAYAASRPSDHKGTGGFGGLIKGAAMSPLGGLALMMMGGPMGMFGGPGAFVGEAGELAGAGAATSLASGAGDAPWGTNPRVPSGPMSTMGGQFVDPTTLQMTGGAPMSTTGSLATNSLLPVTGSTISPAFNLKDFIDGVNDKMPTTGNKAVDNLLTKAATSLLGGGATAATPGGAGGDTTGVDQQAADEARKQALRDQIRGMFDPNNFADTEQELGDAIRTSQGNALHQKYDTAKRSTTFDMARRGNVGGSVMATNLANLNRDNELGSTKIEDAVNQSLASLRSGRQNAESGALSLVDSGSGPDAVAAAGTGIKNAIDAARAATIPDTTAGLFQNVALSDQGINQLNNNASLAAYINSKRGGGQLFGTNGSRNNGTVIQT